MNSLRIPRCEIVRSGEIVHMIWRCHNGDFLLSSKKIKEKIIELYFKHKDKFEIDIIDFQNLDNHSHWVLRAKNAKLLGDFARVVHSQIASYVNKLHNRNSQVFRDRYKSPAVRDEKHLRRLIAYVILNRTKADKKSRPENDPFCSAYHRLHKTKFGQLLLKYSDLGLCEVGTDNKFLKQLIKTFIANLLNDSPCFNQADFVNSFLVGSKSMVNTISKEISSRLKKHNGLSLDQCAFFTPLS